MIRKEADTTTQPHPPSGGWDLSSEDVVGLISPVLSDCAHSICVDYKLPGQANKSLLKKNSETRCTKISTEWGIWPDDPNNCC